MKKRNKWILGIIILIIILLAAIYICYGLTYCDRHYCRDIPISEDIYVNYSCNSYLDCVSTCNWGCMNKGSAEIYLQNDGECKSAYDCTCVDKVCYSDGRMMGTL